MESWCTWHGIDSIERDWFAEVRPGPSRCFSRGVYRQSWTRPVGTNQVLILFFLYFSLQTSYTILFFVRFKINVLVKPILAFYYFVNVADLSSITEPGRLIIILAMLIANGSSIWDCSTTLNRNLFKYQFWIFWNPKIPFYYNVVSFQTIHIFSATYIQIIKERKIKSRKMPSKLFLFVRTVTLHTQLTLFLTNPFSTRQKIWKLKCRRNSQF